MTVCHILSSFSSQWKTYPSSVLQGRENGVKLIRHTLLMALAVVLENKTHSQRTAQTVDVMKLEVIVLMTQYTQTHTTAYIADINKHIQKHTLNN